MWEYLQYILCQRIPKWWKYVLFFVKLFQSKFNRSIEHSFFYEHFTSYIVYTLLSDIHFYIRLKCEWENRHMKIHWFINRYIDWIYAIYLIPKSNRKLMIWTTSSLRIRSVIKRLTAFMPKILLNWFCSDTVSALENHIISTWIDFHQV